VTYVINISAFEEYSLSFKQGLHVYNCIDKTYFDMNTLVSEVRKTLFEKYNVDFSLPAFLGIAIGYWMILFQKQWAKCF